jgi:ergothioneine biosynthesis protein EgtB
MNSEPVRKAPALALALSQIEAMLARFTRVRAQTEALARPLSPEDCQAQSMPDASPVKWHLAHVTWFFETFLLERYEPGFVPHNPAFRVLFNSYYNAVGDKHPRAQRGAVTRPSMAEVMAWRAAVDERVDRLLRSNCTGERVALLELGLQHEQQHQELLLTDVKHLLSQNPMQPAYAPAWPLASVAPVRAAWVGFAGGLVDIGQPVGGVAAAEGPEIAFHFDNESPRHRHFLRPYALVNRLVTHGEWRAFINDGAYQNPRWWLSAGWDWVNANGIEAPLYWRREENSGWSSFTLHGRVPLDDHTPVTHVSLYEADAFARWLGETQADFKGARLPNEFEWEAAAAPGFKAALSHGNFAESRALHPMPVARAQPGLLQTVGDVWEWTSSSYNGYPGYQPWAGAVGEYNGKFMVNQYVLRGGSCATPASHVRATYRNFFQAEARWQFSGLRLARDSG